MSIYDYMSNFWYKNEYKQCSMTEIALYFCLLYEANRQHWASPFKASTQMLIARLGTSKQNVMKARDSLMRRGLISYVKGDGKGKPALYTLLISPADDCGQSQEFTQPLTQMITPVMTQQVTQTLPLPNKKEEDSINAVRKETPSPSQSNKELTLDELQEKLLADTEWMNGLSKRLSAVGIAFSNDNLRGKINEFFDDLRSRKVTHKEENDCRNHVFSWIKYHNKNNNYGQERKCESKAGPTQISDNRPEDYKGAC
jgi:hypothetical protein